jgi:hypothetical protein
MIMAVTVKGVSVAAPKKPDELRELAVRLYPVTEPEPMIRRPVEQDEGTAAKRSRPASASAAAVTARATPSGTVISPGVYVTVRREPVKRNVMAGGALDLRDAGGETS